MQTQNNAQQTKVPVPYLQTINSEIVVPSHPFTYVELYQKVLILPVPSNFFRKNADPNLKNGAELYIPKNLLLTYFDIYIGPGNFQVAVNKVDNLKDGLTVTASLSIHCRDKTVTHQGIAFEPHDKLVYDEIKQQKESKPNLAFGGPCARATATAIRNAALIHGIDRMRKIDIEMKRKS